MKLRFERAALAALSLALLTWLAVGAAAQDTQAQDAQTQEGQEPKPEQKPTPPPKPVRIFASRDSRLPNGQSQREEILKSEYRQNVEDARRLAELSDQLRDDLVKGNHGVLALSDLRKTDEIEKLVKKIRERMRR